MKTILSLVIVLVSLTVFINATYKSDAEDIMDIILKEKAMLHNVVWMSTEFDSNGGVHVRFQQRYRSTSIPILNGFAIVHFIGNETDVTNDLQDVTQTILTIPLVGSLVAVLNALGSLLGGYTFELYVVPGSGGSCTLNWLIGGSYTVISTTWFWVNAVTGVSSLWYVDRKSVDSSGISVYNGAVNFTTLQYISSYYMEDKPRKIGIFDCGGDSNCASPSRIDQINNNYWNSSDLHRRAASVLWGTAQAYDYFATTFGRVGIDGSGGPFLAKSVDSVSNNIFPSYINFGSNVNDAYFSTNGIFYGNGDGVRSGSTVSIDMIGHEVMHGIITNTANLYYTNEQGAVTESWCDIFGILVKMYATRALNSNFTFGEDSFTPNIVGDALRYLHTPALGNGSYHYAGRYTGSEDNGGVHVNSGIGNRAFYLLVMGGNNNYSTYAYPTMTGIGLDDASKIWFLAMTSYMTSSTSLFGARIACENAAKNLFGISSNQYIATSRAWGQVGVGSYPEVTDTVQNGNFEDAPQPWQITGSAGSIVHQKNGKQAKAGLSYVTLGNINSMSGVLEQIQLNITNNSVSANLTFWIQISTSESTSTLIYDQLFVELRNSSGVLLSNIAAYTNLDSNANYFLCGPYNLINYKNNPNMKLSFRVSSSASNPTTFKLDLVQLQVK